MEKQEEVKSKYVEKTTMLFVAFATLVLGFILGFVIGPYKGDPAPSATTSAQSGLTSHGQDLEGEVADKISALQKEVSSNPQNAVAWTQLGHFYFRYVTRYGYDKVIESYEKSLALNPDNRSVWTTLGVAYRRNAQPIKALDAFDNAIRIDPRFEASHFHKGVVLVYEMGDRQGGVQAWEELLKINPAAMAPDGKPDRDLIEQVQTQQSQQEGP